VSRFVVPQRTQVVADQPDKPSGMAERIVKYVPAEVVAPFTIATGVVASANLAADVARWVAIALIGFFLVVTIVYFITRTSGIVRIAHLVVSPLAFLAWAYAISSGLLGAWFIGWICALAQAVVVGLALMVNPSES
jgi:hypothetical protein